MRRFAVALAVVLAGAGWWGQVAAAAPQAATQPARVLPAGQTTKDLTAFLLERVPKFETPGDTTEDATVQRLLAGDRRERMLNEVVFKGVPKSWTAGEAKMVWQNTLDGPEYVIKKLRYEVVPGLWAGALLYEPKGLKQPTPAVLSVNGHVGPRGLNTPYEQIRCINLAKRGMLVLYPDWIGMGQLSAPGYSHTELTCLDLCGTAGVSVFYLELKRGLDVLLAQPHADPERVAVTGLSGGGWQTIFIGALDLRVKLAVPNAGFISLDNRIKYLGDVGDPEQNPVDMMRVGDYPDMVALLAPRPALLIYNDKDDCCFQADRAKRSVYDPIVPVYKLLGAADQFELHINSDPGTHNYEKDNRQAFYHFINKHFLPAGQRRDEEIPCAGEVPKPEEIKIEYPKDNADFYTLAAALMKDLPAAKRPDIADVIRASPGAQPSAGTAHEEPAGDGTTRRARVLQVGVRGAWHLPVVEYVPQGTPTDWAVVVADTGLAGAEPVLRELRKDASRYVAVVDVLFTGECQPDDRAAWQWAQVISTAGERTLGIQAAQLAEAINFLGTEQARAHPLPAGPPHFRVVTVGKVAGLAALAMAAGHVPTGSVGIERMELHALPASLKQLIETKLTYVDAPSIFCFGLLPAADIPHMVQMAAPVKVVLSQ